jgi:excisionase family DNA binding protein
MMVRVSNDNLEQVFLTSTQAAELLNISLVTLKKYISLGKIRTIKTPGGHHRINKQDLLENLYD